MKHLLLALALLQGMAAYAGEVHSNGYTVRFDERIETAPGDLHGATVGRISIARAADQALAWQENTPLQPGCGAIAAITVLNDAERYWQHYRATRQAAPAADVLPELLASLLAAQAGKQSICAELATLAADLQQGQQYEQYDTQGARTLMRTWLHKLPAIGYPAFDTQACPGRI